MPSAHIPDSPAKPSSVAAKSNKLPDSPNNAVNVPPPSHNLEGSVG